jgi:hypothetical protein
VSYLDQTTEKLPFKKYHVYAFANPRSGDGLAARFLSDFPPSNTREVYIEECKQSAICKMNFYNVLEKQERDKCLKDLATEM